MDRICFDLCYSITVLETKWLNYDCLALWNVTDEVLMG